MLQNMWTTFMILLLLINGMAMSMSYMSVSQDGTTLLGSLWGNDILTGIEGQSTFYRDMIDTGISTDFSQDTNVQATIIEGERDDVFKTLLFGAATGFDALTSVIGGAFAIIALIGQLLFGYFLWIDYLLNPMWGPVVAALNAMLKFVIFVIQIIGLVEFTKGFYVRN